MVSDSTLPGFVNFMSRFVFAEGQRSGNADIASSYIPDYSEEVSLADRPEDLIARLNRILVAGQLRPEIIDRIAEFVGNLPLGDTQATNEGDRLRRVMYAVLMVLTTPEYSVQL